VTRCDAEGAGVRRLTIEGTDARHILLPAKMLAVDLAKVSDEEGVFFARFAHLMVDSLDTFVKGFANELLRGIDHSIVLGRIQDWFLQRNMWVIDIIDVSVEDCRCHNHIPNRVRNK
jgi:hypothetical protein